MELNNKQLSSELEKLKHAFVAMKENNDKISQRVAALEKIHEQQKERIEFLEKENCTIKNSKLCSNSNNRKNNDDEYLNEPSDTAPPAKRKRVQLIKQDQEQTHTHPTHGKNNKDEKPTKMNLKDDTINVEINADNIDSGNNQGNVSTGEEISSFESLSDDLLHDVLEFTGKKSYAVFGLLDKRCNQVFADYNLPKETSLHGYASLDIIVEKYMQKIAGDETAYDMDEHMVLINHLNSIAKAVFQYNRSDLLEWVIELQDDNLSFRVCTDAIQHRNFDVLKTMFRRSTLKSLNYLRTKGALCNRACSLGQLDTLKWLHAHRTEWDHHCLFVANSRGYDDIIEYLRLHGCPESRRGEDYSMESESEPSSDDSDDDSDGSFQHGLLWLPQQAPFMQPLLDD
eukprot:CAMPEP_0178946384 /NCGR_PEP_ID=MMETSP0789-20121207/4254_1 /TAXON_ID=3005 /ORGANISM="Rhizosolenia setigera, Strain CCMP 1694" /LENGTH=398 /DNA_ID=CAMNT_0020626367 /DNA_START=52 /DNA_END=1249 /DNA_ORIENTATION=+